MSVRAAAAAAAGVASLGCSSFFGSEATGDVQVRFQQFTAPALSLEGAGMAAIDAEDVASLMVTVTDIQFLPAGSEDADGSWQSMTLGSPVEVNLAALPEGGESPVVIAAGALEVGDYSQVRLFVGAATIEFANAVTLGQATSFDAGTGYPVDIPSGTQTGIKTDVSFSVTDDGAGGTNAVDLVFDSGATYANVNATGSGRVSMAPVVRAP